MSTNNDAHTNLAGAAPLVGGPPVDFSSSSQSSYQAAPTGCTAADFALYNSVQKAIDCTVASEGPNVSSLGQAAVLGSIYSQPPFSCMTELLTGPLSDCGVTPDAAARQAAYNTFVEVTGFKPADLAKSFNDQAKTTKKLFVLNSFYFFGPVLLLILIVTWLMVGVGWIPWAVGLFFSVFAIVVLYGFAILYRYHGHNILNKDATNIENDLTAAQKNLQDTVALLPQGLYAVACSLTTATGNTAWICNENPGCPPCTAAATVRSRNQTPEEPDLTATARTIRRRRQIGKGSRRNAYTN